MATESGNALANQLGLLEYCQSKGDIDASPVKAEQAVIALSPPGGDAGAAAAAEGLGKQGTISMQGVNKSMSDQASAQNETVPELCKNMGAIAVQLGSAFQQMPAMPSMPPPPQP